MKPIITKFNTSTGDTEIMIAVPYRDPWESHINQPMPAYEEKEHYNIFCLIKENQELKKQLEYLRSGEYLNQLKFERNMLEDVVNKGEVSKEDKEFIDMTHRNTELLEQQKEFIECLEKEIVDSRAGSGQQYYAQNHLRLYKEIIGKDINVSTKEVKNDD